jgi:hypothetical protein
MVDQKREDFMSQIEHYRAVLDDLHRQRDLHSLKVTEIDKAISSLHRLIPADAKEEFPTPNYSMASTPTVRAGKYAGMSVRWAILCLLSEDATGPMGTGDIADALRRGGIVSTSKNFNGNVSAVLSDMNNTRKEVQSSPEGGWTISQVGRQVWSHIRHKKEAQQDLISSSVQ